MKRDTAFTLTKGRQITADKNGCARQHYVYNARYGWQTKKPQKILVGETFRTIQIYPASCTMSTGYTVRVLVLNNKGVCLLAVG